MGEYGFWIFEEYVPTLQDCTGTWGGNTQHIFDTPIAWGTKRGFEIASAGNGGILLSPCITKKIKILI